MLVSALPTHSKAVVADKYIQICQSTLCFLSFCLSTHHLTQKICARSMIFMAESSVGGNKRRRTTLWATADDTKMIPLFWLKFYYACFNEIASEMTAKTTLGYPFVRRRNHISNNMLRRNEKLKAFSKMCRRSKQRDSEAMGVGKCFYARLYGEG